MLVNLVTMPCAAGLTVTVSTVMMVEKESLMITLRIGAVPVLPAVMVKVKRSLTLASLGVTTTRRVATGDGSRGGGRMRHRWGGRDGGCMGWCMGVGWSVGRCDGGVLGMVGVLVTVGVLVGVAVSVGVGVSVLVAGAVGVSVEVEVGVSVGGAWRR